MFTKYQHTLLVLLAVGALTLSAACSFKVVFPAGFQTSSQDFQITGDRLEITVRFNHPVDRSTVVVGQTLILVTEKDPNATGALTWAADSKSFTFRTNKTIGDLLIFDADGFFTLKLAGTNTGNGVILDQDGKVLDGDSDNSAGGNYETTFVLIG